MGKKRKVSSNTTSNEGDTVLPHNVSEDKKKKKTEKVADCNVILEPEDNLTISEVKEVRQKNKSKKKYISEHRYVSEVENTDLDPTMAKSDVISDNPDVTEDRKGEKHKSKKLSQEMEESTERSSQNSLSNKPSLSSHNTGKSKKIIFINDQPQAVLDAPKTRKNRNKGIKNEEEEINDEDIDKFCDELTEEDNIQYDDWIKLVEAKMHPKSK